MSEPITETPIGVNTSAIKASADQGTALGTTPKFTRTDIDALAQKAKRDLTEIIKKSFPGIDHDKEVEPYSHELLSAHATAERKSGSKWKAVSSDPWEVSYPRRQQKSQEEASLEKHDEPYIGRPLDDIVRETHSRIAGISNISLEELNAVALNLDTQLKNGVPFDTIVNGLQLTEDSTASPVIAILYKLNEEKEAKALGITPEELRHHKYEEVRQEMAQARGETGNTVKDLKVADSETYTGPDQK